MGSGSNLRGAHQPGGGWVGAGWCWCWCCCIRRRDRWCGRCATGRPIQPIQHVEPDFAAHISSLGREQAGLQRQQAQGELRLDAKRRRVARVGVQARGHVYRQHRSRACVDGRNPLRHAAFRLPGGRRCANAQQGVYAHIKLFRRRIGKAHACIQRALARRRRISRCRGRCAEPGQHDLLAPALQVYCSFQPIAAVVAWAARNPDASGVRRDGQRQPGNRPARALHQRVGRQTRRACVLKQTRGVDTVQGHCNATLNDANQSGNWGCFWHVHGMFMARRNGSSPDCVSKPGRKAKLFAKLASSPCHICVNSY